MERVRYILYILKSAFDFAVVTNSVGCRLRPTGRESTSCPPTCVDGN